MTIMRIITMIKTAAPTVEAVMIKVLLLLLLPVSYGFTTMVLFLDGAIVVSAVSAGSAERLAERASVPVVPVAKAPVKLIGDSLLLAEKAITVRVRVLVFHRQRQLIRLNRKPRLRRVRGHFLDPLFEEPRGLPSRHAI